MHLWSAEVILLSWLSSCWVQLAAHDSHIPWSSWLAREGFSHSDGGREGGQTEQPRLFKTWAWNKQVVTSVYIPLSKVNHMTECKVQDRESTCHIEWR